MTHIHLFYCCQTLVMVRRLTGTSVELKHTVSPSYRRGQSYIFITPNFQITHRGIISYHINCIIIFYEV